MALVAPAGDAGMALATIIQQLGLTGEGQLSDELVQHAVEACRAAGNKAFRAKDYREAVKFYTQALAGAPDDGTLHGNRSAAHLALGLLDDAAWDARRAVSLRPNWPKAYYRLGCACLALGQWAEAEAALAQGLQLEPGAEGMAAKLAEAQQHLAFEAAAREAQAATERRGVVTKLRAARREDHRLTQLNQFKQSMSAPDWELEDLEWRPTWLPSMRLKQLNREAVLAEPRRAMLASYVTALADLAAPKQALRVLGDAARLRAFQCGIEAALRQRPSADALVLGAGGGLLALLAAQAGCARVTAVERSRMLFRMAKQCLEANATGEHATVAARVCLLDRRLQSVGVEGEGAPPDVLLAAQQRAKMAAAGLIPQDLPASTDTGALLPRRAALLVTDLLDHSVLGMGLLPALDYAAERLLAPGAVVVPQRVQVYACLLELRVGTVNGFDLSALNAYWWHPGAERLELASMPHRRLSAPFAVRSLDLQARVDAGLARQAAASGGDGAAPSGSSSSQQAAGDASSSPPSSASGSGDRSEEQAAWEHDAWLEVPVTGDGHWNAVVLWFDVHTGGSAVVTSWKEGRGSEAGSGDVRNAAAGTTTAEGQSPAAATSWGQAVQYLDGRAVQAGVSVRLRVRQDAGQLVFTSDPPQCRPRHALVPRWHFDMVLDAQRNEAYADAIGRAVQRKRELGCTKLLALDLGAGTGLLSMMAARAGADEVFAAEVSQHMCDVGEEACIMNGFLGRITLLDRDARRLDVLRKADGTPPDLPRRADLLVYEVFDSGCIGEGVLHILAAAQAKLLTPTAALVPLSARVWCQPIQLRLGKVLGFDCSQANRWRWRPDYEGLELGRCRDDWVLLADPVEAFFFDFTDVMPHMAPAQVPLRLQFNKAGVFNAVALWFDLHLDEETMLSTNPYTDKGPTWQQAVQWVREVEVAPGQELELTASHDTYSISFALPPDLDGAVGGSGPGTHMQPVGAAAAGMDDATSQAAGDSAMAGPRPTGVPLVDPAWRAAYDQLQGMNSQLVKACVQNPLEYRAVALAALQFAARPHDLGLDAQQAAEFCIKSMG